MRLLLVSPYFPPQNAIASLRAYAFAQHWSEQGVDLTVLTTRKREDQRGLEKCCDEFEIVEIPYKIPRIFEVLRRKHKSSQIEGKSRQASSPASGRSMRALDKLRGWTGILGSVRMPDLTDYWVKPAVSWCKEQQHWDVVVSSCGPYTAHLVALTLKKQLHAKRWVADFRDLWVGNHIYRGLFPFTLRERALQKRCLAESDFVTTVSEELAENLRPRTRAQVKIVYNGFDPRDFESLNKERIFPDDDLVRIVYTGTLYKEGQDPSPILNALRALKKNDPRLASKLKLVTAGHGCERWQQLAKQFKVTDSVEINDVVKRSDALRMQRDADALLLIDWRDSSAGVLTGKLFEYLGQRAPILVVGGQGDSAITQVIKKTCRGRCFASDEKRIADALVQLVDSPQSLCDTPNHEVISSFTREAQSMRLLEMIKNLK